MLADVLSVELNICDFFIFAFVFYKLFLTRFYFMPMSVLNPCMYVHVCTSCPRIEDDVRPPRTGSVDGCEAHGYWEPSSQHLQEC